MKVIKQKRARILLFKQTSFILQTFGDNKVNELIFSVLKRNQFKMPYGD